MTVLERFQQALESPLESPLSSFPVSPPIKTFVVAYSGGLDSHVLLHLCQQHDLPCRAVHIHHGLQAQADQWSQHCEQVCKNLHILCKTIHVDASAANGDSPEDAARKARYHALYAELGADECLLTGHHQDDQAETVLLQLFRGAGAAGLASMPSLRRLETGWHMRPLLDISRDEIHDYAKQLKLKWIEDPSNEDIGFDRNRLRHEVLPLIKQRWPNIGHSLVQVTHQQQEYLEIIEAMAAVDLATVLTQDTSIIALDKLKQLSHARQINCLRYWIRHSSYDNPTANVLNQIIDSVINATQDAEPVVRWAQTEVRRYQQHLYLLAAMHELDSATVHQWNTNDALILDAAGIKLSIQRNIKHGLDMRLLNKPLSVRFRQGGERIRPVGRQHSHSLKNLMQEAGVPPWQRTRIPLIYADDKLISVSDRWLADEYVTSSETGWRPICSH